MQPYPFDAEKPGYITRLCTALLRLDSNSYMRAHSGRVRTYVYYTEHEEVVAGSLKKLRGYK